MKVFFKPIIIPIIVFLLRPIFKDDNAIENKSIGLYNVNFFSALLSRNFLHFSLQLVQIESLGTEFTDRRLSILKW